MSVQIAEIKAIDNQSLLERYIKKDENILFDMAKDMMGKDGKLLALKINTRDSFGVGLYNLDTKESLITALPKWMDSNLDDTKKVNHILSDIFRDISSGSDLMMSSYDVSGIEEEARKIIQGNSTVISQNISITDLNMSSSIDEDSHIEFDIQKSFSSTGSLFDKDFTHEEITGFHLTQLQEVIDSGNDVIRSVNTEINNIANEAEVVPEINQEEVQVSQSIWEKV